MNILTEFVEENMRLPSAEDPDRAFILSFERSPSNDPKQYFCFFITTLRLLEMSANSKNLHADATYKVTTEKLPLIVVGSTDMNRTFHLIGLTITSDETAENYRFTFQSVISGIYKATGKEYVPETMVSDADQAIHKGNRLCFGDKSKDSALWKRATCTCPAFGDKYMCKHIIGIAKQIGALDLPEKITITNHFSNQKRVDQNVQPPHLTKTKRSLKSYSITFPIHLS